MNISTNIFICQSLRPNGFNLLIYETKGFYYTSKAVTALNFFSSPVSAIGNGLVLLAILRTPSLHTPANILIGAMCVVDFLTGVIVQQMSTAFMLSHHLRLSCAFATLMIFVGLACVCTSVSLMAAISVDRYLALFYALRYNVLVTNNRACLLIFAVCAFWSTIIGITIINLNCFYISIAVGSLAWLIMCIAIVYSYIKIIFLRRHHSRQIQAQHAAVSMPTETASHSKLAVTMGYVIGVALVCYLPTLVTFILYMNVVELSPQLFNGFLFTMEIQFMNSSFNPVIYCWRRQEIRQPILSMLRGAFPCLQTNNQ